MPLTPCPGRGAVITYLNPDVLHPAAVLSGVVLGAHVVDPETSHLWIPVLLPDSTIAVLDTANIMQVEPPESAAGSREAIG
ncbi:hypothetical protein [Lentzea jiangxiensis]|uniref:Uncharacterized protein n=1 Tax=Lentzea jiangxiensis TaxID=641025 RepID=A0A1H0JUU7_9PSEU|nr:hypothetical protein [Lentzea jiangxiensis]SDO47299.1 hypothetical protein SAMN05421507_102641 [Lentzea jiangxiensis]